MAPNRIKKSRLNVLLSLAALILCFNSANASMSDPVGLCKDQKQYVFFVFDLSRSITRRRGKVWQQLKPQREYFDKAMQLFQDANPSNTRYAISFYSSITGDLRKLDRNSATDAAGTRKVLNSYTTFAQAKWDRGNFRNFFYKGNGYTHVGQSLKQSVYNQLVNMPSANTTVSFVLSLRARLFGTPLMFRVRFCCLLTDTRNTKSTVSSPRRRSLTNRCSLFGEK